MSSKWFPRFMLGAKQRMGIIRKQNEALTVEQMMGCLQIAEDDLEKARTEGERKMIEELCCFVIIGFCVSLWGEEIPLTSLDGTLKF